MTRAARSQGGFTLIEVMVAFAIAVAGLTVVATSMQQHIASAQKLRDRTMAMYVASNALSERRLNGEFPDVGRSTDEVTFAERRWQVETAILETGIEGLRRIDVSVATIERSDERIGGVSGFVSNRPPVQASALPGYINLDGKPE